MRAERLAWADRPKLISANRRESDKAAPVTSQPISSLKLRWGLIGALGALRLFDLDLSVIAIIGLLMLIGIVVTNAIVLVDLINQYRERGMSARDAIEHGAARRLRPILMTAAATIFALLPLGIGITGNGGFISQPLAIIVIGGLVSSTILKRASA